MSRIADLRKDYRLRELDEKDVHKEPIVQFEKWFEEARETVSGEVNAMVLSTSGTMGRPSSRVVLLKDYSEKGFVFFTNYASRKGKEMNQNDFASLLFFWGELERQIRIEGNILKISDKESDAYFSSRPRMSQLGAVASMQSTPIRSREELEKNFARLEQKYADKPIPRPQNWGGYLLKPVYFEFWQGRRNRLHDRITYTLESGKWILGRLSP